MPPVAAPRTVAALGIAAACRARPAGAACEQNFFGNKIIGLADSNKVPNAFRPLWKQQDGRMA
jgi:hypothetical protein